MQYPLGQNIPGMLLEQFQEKGQYRILGGTEIGEEMLQMRFALTGHTDSCATGSKGRSQTIHELRRNFLSKNQAACRVHSKQLKGEGQKWLTAQEKLSPATFPSVDQNLTAKSWVQPQSEQEGHRTGKLRQLNFKITFSAGQWILLPSLACRGLRCHSTLGIYIQGIWEPFEEKGSQVNKWLTK